MNQPIPTATHGVIDYVTVGALATLPRVFKWSPRLTNLLTGSAASMLTYSLLTDYELSLFNVIPMRAHLALDGLSALLAGSAPFVAREQKPSAKAVLIGVALFEATVTALTKPQRTVKGRVMRFMGRQISLPAATRVGRVIGRQARPIAIGRVAAFTVRQARPTTIGRAAAFIGRRS